MNDFPSLKTCPHCKESFPRTAEYFHRAKNRPDGLYNYCKTCKLAFDKAYRENPVGKKTIEERFWEKVDKGAPDECWEWTGGLFGGGYGGFSIDEETRIPAHRFAYELEIEAIPDELFLLHRCDNRPCVNPNHLSPGTHEDNMIDMVEKDRQAQGEDHGQSKLTNPEVVEIRKLYETGEWTQAALAERFKVAQSLISYVVRHIRWKHID